MTAPGQYLKSPTANLDYGVDWSPWLATGETISTSTWTIQTGLTSSNPANTNTLAIVWLAGGAPGVNYTAQNQITTSQGRTDARTLHILCQAR